MARPRGQHSADIPDYLWEALEATAQAKNITTAHLIADWLTEAAWRHADDVYADPATAKRLAALPRVDGRYKYPRRQTASSTTAREAADVSDVVCSRALRAL